MKKAAIAIGVNRANGLTPLRAAASDAWEFADWAQGQGFDTRVFADENRDRTPAPAVTFKAIEEHVTSVVDMRTYSQIIVFFSGHGILRSPGCEVWFLSGAPASVNEAINMFGSVELARSCGIPHVVLISDACRSIPPTNVGNRVAGGVIFPNRESPPPRPQVDRLYATLHGDTAKEMPLADAIKKHGGIYTAFLLRGLRGDVPRVIEPDQDTAASWVVRTYPLSEYLKEEVPDASAKVHPDWEQTPDGEVESHPPRFLARVARPPAAIPTGPVPIPASPAPMPSGSISIAGLGETRTPPAWDLGARAGAGHPATLGPGAQVLAGLSGSFLSGLALRLGGRREIVGAMNTLAGARGRGRFETKTGFSVIGATVDRALATRSKCEVLIEHGISHVRIYVPDVTSDAESILFQFDDHSSTALAVYPGYIGTVVVDAGQVVQVSYSPSEWTPRYHEYEMERERVEARRAFAAAASRHGSFRLQADQSAGQAAMFLRELKAIDPTFGIYAAYAYSQAGDREGIESVCSYMEDGLPSVPFDVALLAGRLTQPRAGMQLPPELKVSPFCPMLTQGWALLGIRGEPVQPAVLEAGQFLVPGLWTHFTHRGFEILYPEIKNGRLS